MPLPLPPRNLHPSPPTCRLRVMALGWHLVQMPLGQGRCPSHPDLILQLMFSRATNLPLRVTARWVWAPPGQTRGQDPSVSGCQGSPRRVPQGMSPSSGAVVSHARTCSMPPPTPSPPHPLPVSDPRVSLKQPPDGHSEDVSLGLGVSGCSKLRFSELVDRAPGTPQGSQHQPNPPQGGLSRVAQPFLPLPSPGPQDPGTLGPPEHAPMRAQGPYLSAPPVSLRM